jgi:hypothetical protein
LRSLMYALRPPRPELSSLNHVARGPRRRSRMIRKPILLIVEIIGIVETVEISGIAEITGTNSSNLPSRRREDRSTALLI